MRDKDLDGGDELSKGDARVALPLLELVDVVEEDEEVVRLALVVDLALLGAAARHDVERGGWSRGVVSGMCRLVKSQKNVSGSVEFAVWSCVMEVWREEGRCREEEKWRGNLLLLRKQQQALTQTRLEGLQ